MKVNPVGPPIPFLMRFKNTDNQTNKSGAESKANPSFKEVLEEMQCQPLRPLFKGAPPTYHHNMIPTLKCVPTTEQTPGRLNFKA